MRSVISVLCLSIMATAQSSSGQAFEITNVHQLRMCASPAPSSSHAIRLEGDVWWVNPAQHRLVLHDDSGAAELEMDFRGASIAAGRRAMVEGTTTIIPMGASFRLGPVGPVVDNDGVHGMVEKSGSVYLPAGRAPLRVEWFNGVEKYGLEVAYAGPDLPKQKIPNAALWRQAPGSHDWVQGLDFVCAAATQEMLPDFNSAPPLKIGAATNFDLGVIDRSEHVGVSFSGAVEIPRAGLYTFFTTSDDGSQLYAGEPPMHLTDLGPANFPQPTPLPIGQLPPNSSAGSWVEVEGKVTFASETSYGLRLELSSGSGRMPVEVAPSAGMTAAGLLNQRIRATGFCEPAFSSDGQEVMGVLLAPGARWLALAHHQPNPAASLEATNSGLAVLTTAAEIHRLKRDEAQRELPVRLRGVITSALPEHQAFTLQDSTRGIYVIDFSESLPSPPRIGDFLEVEGVTEPGEFAPTVSARRVSNLGLGDLPEPVRPTRDQLMNGSLDAQYVELQGVLTAVQEDGVILLTPDGRLKAELRVNGLTPADLTRFEDARLRVRGCLLAKWNYVNHEVKVGEIRMNGADLTVDQPAPSDLFSTPRKTAAELFLFDPQASVFQRVKVSGQILHVRDPDCFLMDGSNGVRFIPKHAERLEVGDLVDVVGFPELSSGPPVLREAVVRKTGHAALPPARALSPDDFTRPDLDSTAVRVKAILVNQRNSPSGQALEMRVGLRSFLALLPAASDDIRAIPLGSQLELTGTYASQGVSQDAASFGLLLNSPADVTVLARPPWWTLEKMLVILGALACILVGTALWITQLRRKVGQRTAELEIQIRERQRAEQKHAMELERARIAQDLHDELGSSLTEISMLGVRAKSESAQLAAKGSYLEQMSDRARQMVTALDEIVWAMNPTHDSLASMVSYFSLYADRFLSLANIAWRLDDAVGSADYAMDSRHRHQLFLAFKEALTNIVRHSGATEVRLDIKVERGRALLSIADNGRGFPAGSPTPHMDGVANMRARLEKLGGHFSVTSAPHQGATVRFDLPLRQ
ncbi:MAG TPA: ATP-binding protein [Verrucomicrobiae bacterium]|jgi:signal transduction histidine kinase|nr:ATP-binding protein [Verrucomicrobiae bacterium]